MQVSDERTLDWCALMIDMDPDEWPDPSRIAREVWVNIPGKHRNGDAAWEAIENMIATRH